MESSFVSHFHFKPSFDRLPDIITTLREELGKQEDRNEELISLLCWSIRVVFAPLWVPGHHHHQMSSDICSKIKEIAPLLSYTLFSFSHNPVIVKWCGEAIGGCVRLGDEVGRFFDSRIAGPLMESLDTYQNDRETLIGVKEAMITLGHSSTRWAEKLVDEHTMSLLVKLLGTYRDDCEVFSELANLILVVSSLSSERQTQFASLQLVQALMEGLKVHRENARATRKVVRIITKLTACDTEGVVTPGLIPLLVETLGFHTHRPESQFICKAFGSIAYQSPQIASEIIANGAIPLIKEVLENMSSDKEIVEDVLSSLKGVIDAASPEDLTISEESGICTVIESFLTEKHYQNNIGILRRAKHLLKKIRKEW
eukprot:TRINITY_DN8454_c0_g1_i1.p1 TRINITY_DN8454_c0_g1~~TRINITY_DN8454_c0_g1_i1.p1  ORF type:complete len:370 (+),score=79.20 TRINITY_DN8454_c0_g1_i1:78-1187(+)